MDWFHLLSGLAVLAGVAGAAATPFARSRAVGRRLVLLGGLACVPAWAAGVYAIHDDVLHAAGETRELAGLRWYQRARVAELSDDEWRALGWRAVWLTGGMVVAVVGAVASSRWRAGLVGVVGGAAAMAVGGGGEATGMWSPLAVHAMVGGVAVAAIGWAGRWVVAAWVAAIATGAWAAGLFGGWERAAATLSQPRDLAHAVAAVAVLGAIGLRGEKRVRAALIAVGVVLAVGTGVLMLFDGSDGASRWWWVDVPVVQHPVR